ncbi:MAG: hypothetical protein U0Q22_03115 [Acidimicrobiales bacterium]
MPIERRSSSAQVRSILIAVVSLIFAVTLGYALFRVATGKSTAPTSNSTSGRWNTGSASSKAKEIAKGGPILLPDPTGAQRHPIFINHVGGKNDTGWYAFEARPPGAPADCFIEWSRTARHFTAPCNDRTYPPEGTGLRSFSAEVTKEGDLVIDLTPSATGK